MIISTHCWNNHQARILLLSMEQWKIFFKTHLLSMWVCVYMYVCKIRVWMWRSENKFQGLFSPSTMRVPGIKPRVLDFVASFTSWAVSLLNWVLLYCSVKNTWICLGIWRWAQLFSLCGSHDPIVLKASFLILPST